MKLPDLPREKMSWDRYKAFHWGVSFGGVSSPSDYSYPPFTVFDTGEVMLTRRQMNPDKRGMYHALNVGVWGTSDDGSGGLPQLFLPDGTAVKRAWYDHGGQQHLLVDFDTKRAVRTDIVLQLDPDPRPLRLRTWAMAYFPGEGLPPVGGPITVNRPWKQVADAEQREHVQTMIDVQAMELALLDKVLCEPRHPVTLPRLLSVASWKDLGSAEQSALSKGRIAAYDPFDYLVLA